MRAGLPLLITLALLTLGLAACTDIEGNEPGECSDGADNDSDRYFDCEDIDCWGAPACDESDDDDASDDDDTSPDDDDDDVAPDDDDATDDDDDSTPANDGVTPYITLITYVYVPGEAKFTFSVSATDPDNNFGVPLLLWSVDTVSQPPVSVGSVPLAGEVDFDIDLGGVTPAQSYDLHFAIGDTDGNLSAGYFIQAAAQ